MSCACGSNKSLKFQIEIRKIERGMAVLLLSHCLFNAQEPFFVYLLVGDELGSATDADILLVS